VALNESGDPSGARVQAETALSEKPPAEMVMALRHLLAQVK
jgi:hypothetical protein